MFSVVPKVARRWRAMSLRSHLLIFALLLLLPVMIFVGLLLVKYSTSERARLEEQAVATAVRTAAEIDRELASLVTILDTLAAGQSLARADFPRFSHPSHECTNITQTVCGTNQRG